MYSIFDLSLIPSATEARVLSPPTGRLGIASAALVKDSGEPDMVATFDKSCLDARPIHPPNCGALIAIPQVGRINQRYERLAACGSAKPTGIGFLDGNLILT
jgi:hypothetical protein